MLMMIETDDLQIVVLMVDILLLVLDVHMIMSMVYMMLCVKCKCLVGDYLVVVSLLKFLHRLSLPAACISFFRILRAASMKSGAKGASGKGAWKGAMPLQPVQGGVKRPTPMPAQGGGQPKDLSPATVAEITTHMWTTEMAKMYKEQADWAGLVELLIPS